MTPPLAGHTCRAAAPTAHLAVPLTMRVLFSLQSLHFTLFAHVFDAQCSTTPEDLSQENLLHRIVLLCNLLHCFAGCIFLQQPPSSTMSPHSCLSQHSCIPLLSVSRSCNRRLWAHAFHCTAVKNACVCNVHCVFLMHAVHHVFTFLSVNQAAFDTGVSGPRTLC